MKFRNGLGRNGLGLALFAMLLSASAGAEVPMPTDMPEYIVTAAYPVSGEIDPAPVPPAPAAAKPILDKASVLKELQADQEQAAKAILAKLAGEEAGK